MSGKCSTRRLADRVALDRVVDRLRVEAADVRGVLGRIAAVRAQVHHPVVTHQADAEAHAAEQPLTAVEDLLEHRLGVRHRAADHLQHLGSGGLSFQRLLGLIEQPCVLDRDQRLVAERFGQRDLVGGEGARSGARQGEHANAFVCAQQGKHQRRVDAARLVHAALVFRQVDGGPVGQVQRLLVHHHAGRKVRAGVHGNRLVRQVRNQAVLSGARGQPQPLAVQVQDEGLVAADQRHGRGDDGVEHRLHVGGRAADHAQHVGGGGLAAQRLVRLLEQPRVLDRDHRLVGEGLDQPRVVVAERLHVEVEGRDRAVHLVAQRHRGAEHRAVAA